MKIPFSPPDITEAEIEQVAEALRSGWITTGPKTKELEREVADLCGTNRAVCLNSQTACAEMTLRLLGIHEGDEVITCAIPIPQVHRWCVMSGQSWFLLIHRKILWKWIMTSWQKLLQKKQK